MTFDLDVWHDHLDPIYVIFEGQSHRSKFMDESSLLCMQSVD